MCHSCRPNRPTTKDGNRTKNQSTKHRADYSRWALTRGPVVYALDTVWWDDAATPRPHDVGKEVAVMRVDTELQQRPATPGALGPFYETEVELSGGRRAQATFVPFTNIGRWYRPGEPKPERSSHDFSYAIWLRDRTGVSAP